MGQELDSWWRTRQMRGELLKALEEIKDLLKRRK
jgi:hypothetical protein